MSATFRSPLLAALVALLTACATSPPDEPDDICSIFTEKRDWYLASRDAQARWNTSMHVALAIMYQESSFEKDARPPRTRLLGFIPWKRPSSAYGYAQALDGTWEKYLQATGERGRDRDDFSDAVDFVHWYMNEAVRLNGVSRDDARALYLNYHEGLVGYRRKSHLRKPWLNGVATRVQQRAQRYARQYAACRDSLKPSFWERLFGD